MTRARLNCALVAFALLALAGCAATEAPAAGLSDDERSTIQRMMRDTYWRDVGLPDDQRPPDPTIVTVSLDEWATAFVGCMNDVGFENYTVEGEGIGVTSSGASANDEMVANYLCNSSIWTAGDEGWYNDAQMAYLYDYYEQVLVPCMAMHGAEVIDAPSREKFFDEFGWWHPFSSIRQGDQKAYFGDRQTLVECPPMPPGAPDRWYYTYWDQQW